MDSNLGQNYSRSTKELLSNSWVKFKAFIRRYWFLMLALIGVTAANIDTTRQLNASQKALEVSQKETETYKLRNGELVSSQEILQLDKESMKTELERLKNNKGDKQLIASFSKVNTVTKANTQIRYDTIKIAYHDTVQAVFERSGHFDDTYHSYDYYCNQTGFLVKDLSIPDTVTEVTGVKRKWLLGKETYTIERKHSNPHVSDLGVRSTELKPEKHWYTNPFVLIGAGFITGAILLH